MTKKTLEQRTQQKETTNVSLIFPTFETMEDDIPENFIPQHERVELVETIKNFLDHHRKTNQWGEAILNAVETNVGELYTLCELGKTPKEELMTGLYFYACAQKLVDTHKLYFPELRKAAEYYMGLTHILEPVPG